MKKKRKAKPANTKAQPTSLPETPFSQQQESSEAAAASMAQGRGPCGHGFGGSSSGAGLAGGARSR